MGSHGFIIIARSSVAPQNLAPQRYVEPVLGFAKMAFVPATAIAIHHQLHGPCSVISTGCSAGGDAIGQAFWTIQEGRAERMLAGGSDSAISLASLNVYCAMRALSTRNDEPERASRPYDAQRDGFVMAEGAGVLVLEERELALARHAHIYAEVLTFTSNSNTQYVPIIIVGAGPIGLTLGNLLGIAGIETLILERNAGISTIPKAISIDEGLRICPSLDLGAAILEHVTLDVSAHYVSGKRFLAKVTPTSRRNGYPLISTFSQPESEATLLQGLTRFADVNIRFQHIVETLEQDDSRVIVTVRTPEGAMQSIECAYLLGCDGGKSTLRRKLGIALKGSTFAQKWLVIDALSSEEAAPVITFYCNPSRPAVAVPAPHGRRRWEFMLLPGEKEEEMLSEERIHKLLLQVGVKTVPHIIRKVVYTFHAALATTFARGRVFLVGDAAHLMPPFGGQGMNSGLRDAAHLGWKLQLVLRGLASPKLLYSYTVERPPHVLQMIRFSSLPGSIVMTRARPIAWLRDGILIVMNFLPLTRRFLSEAGTKPASRYKHGFLRRDRSRESRRLAGVLLPQPEVMLAGGRSVLLDDVLGNGFALLRLSDEPRAAFASIQAEVWRQLEIRFVCVQSSGMEPGEYDECVVASEVRQELSRFLGYRRDLFVLVRPDRYVYGVFREKDGDAFALKFHSSIKEAGMCLAEMEARGSNQG